MAKADLFTQCASAQARTGRYIAMLAGQAQLATMADFSHARARLGLTPKRLCRHGEIPLPDYMRCPECGSGLLAEVYDHELDTGAPLRDGCITRCVAEQAEWEAASTADNVPIWTHNHLPGDWAYVRRLAAEWLHLNVRLA